MAAPKQTGTAVVIGFGGLAITGYFAEDGVTYEKSYDNTEIIKDMEGATRTKIRMDKRTVISGTFLANLGTTPATVDGVVPSEGDTISITPVATGSAVVYEVVSASGAMAAGALKINMELIKEDSMTYTTT
jgi:hypothetical protein